MSRTPTTRLALSKPDPGTSEPYDVSIEHGSNLDKIDAAISATECTNATRPTGADAWDGRIIVESDTNKAYIREDGNWRQIAINTGTQFEMDDDVTITGTLTVSGAITSGTSAVDVQVFTGSGTWTKPANAKSVWARVQAAGGAGGGAEATTTTEMDVGGGGGAGGYAEFWGAASSLAATVTVTIGAAGTGVSGANGNAGVAASFGAHAAANGGGAGQKRGVGAANDYWSAAAAGGAATAGTLQIAGGPGLPGNGNALGTLGMSGVGGTAHLGAGGMPVRNSSVPTGLPGNTGGSYGGGGSGALTSGNSASAQAGGNGAPGVVIVVTYF